MRRYALITIAACLAGCQTSPVVVKTERVEIPVPGPVQPIPPALSQDCPPAPLAGTALSQILDRLASVEQALATCRDQLRRIRALP